MRRERVVLLLGLTTIAVILALVLSRSPAESSHRVASGNAVLARTYHPAMVCQGHESIPRGTSVVIPEIGGFTGPRITTSIRAGAREVAKGSRNAGWSGSVVRIPVSPVRNSFKDATICFSFTPEHEGVKLGGNSTPSRQGAVLDGESLPGRIQIEYLHPGIHPWISRLSATVSHIGLGRVLGGSWIAVFVLIVMLTVVAITSRMLFKEPLG